MRAAMGAMADRTGIEWTDATWQPITGCSVVSPGCTNCYAMRLAGTRLKHHASRQGLTRDSKAGPVWTGEVRFNEQWLDQPLRWKHGRRIFVCAHGDLFHESVPDEWIDRVFAVMALAPQHVFQVLTKRAARMRQYLTTSATAGCDRNDDIAGAAFDLRDASLRHGEYRFSEKQCFVQPERWPLPNVWLGVSVEDQARADERLFDLSCTPAARRFASIEPLLGPVDLTRCRSGLPAAGGLAWNALTCDLWSTLTNEVIAGPPKGHGPLDWVVVGGESGPGARPLHPDWARSLRDQCAAFGVSFFMKQMTKKAPIPDDLMVREFPDAR